MRLGIGVFWVPSEARDVVLPLVEEYGRLNG